MAPTVLVDLSNYSAIDVCGVDASRFLQGQTTINVDTPTENKCFLAALCNPKGRVISLFHLIRIEQGYRLIMPNSLIEVTCSHLNKYSVFFKVELVKNPIESFIGAINPTTKLLTSLQSVGISNYQLNDLPLSFIPLTDGQSTDKLIDTSAISLHKDQQCWFSALATHEVCWLSEQTSGEYLPHNLDLPKLRAVDFNKGCFTGQEVIARMQYKGKLKQHMRLFQSNKDQNIDDELLSTANNHQLLQQEKKVGQVICSCISNEKRWTVLALIKDSANNQQYFTVNLKNSPILELVE